MLVPLVLFERACLTLCVAQNAQTIQAGRLGKLSPTEYPHVKGTPSALQQLGAHKVRAIVKFGLCAVLPGASCLLF